MRLLLALSGLLTVYGYAEAHQYKNFVLIAAPGTGKGTFSQYLVGKYDYYHICAGDMLRREIKEQTEFGKLIQPIVERGDYIDNDTMCAIMAQSILQAVAENKSFIVDGFPRAIETFNFLSDFLEQHNLVNDTLFIQLVAPDQVCVERIAHRYVCMKCGIVYNGESVKPKNDNICDYCCTELSQRTADTIPIVRKRLVHFHEQIEPIIQLIQNKYRMYKINTTESLEQLRYCYDQLVQQHNV
jgi:adenylate kinase